MEHHGCEGDCHIQQLSDNTGRQVRSTHRPKSLKIKHKSIALLQHLKYCTANCYAINS